MEQNVALEDKALYDIDSQLDKLVQKIELLSYINPLNLESEKEKFFASKYLTDPVFEYPPIDFDKFKLHKKLFHLPIGEIEDKSIRQLYEDIIYAYSGLIQCIETIGTGKKFYYNSLRSFGSPTENDVENAKFILHFEDEQLSEKAEPKYSATEAERFFREYSKQYQFTYSIKQSNNMSAIAMVLNNIQSLILNAKHTFSDDEIAILTNHEIGVHMVTTMNGLQQPLKIFSHGFPNNVETQEGLAVFSEYMSDNLTLKRLKELAYRVIAVDGLAKGYSFSKTFRMLVNLYNLHKEEAFYITVRVHRGGGFTKDHLYLTGLKKVYDYYKQGKDLSLLLTGKVSIEYIKEISYLIDKKNAIFSKHITSSFSNNKNSNKTIDFILNNLK